MDKLPSDAVNDDRDELVGVIEDNGEGGGLAKCMIFQVHLVLELDLKGFITIL